MPEQNTFIQKINLTTNTISDFILNGSIANTINPAWIVQGPNNTAIARTHPADSQGSWHNSLISIDLATGAVTVLPNNPFSGEPVNGGVAYNPDTNEL